MLPFYLDDRYGVKPAGHRSSCQLYSSHSTEKVTRARMNVHVQNGNGAVATIRVRSRSISSGRSVTRVRGCTGNQSQGADVDMRAQKTCRSRLEAA